MKNNQHRNWFITAALFLLFAAFTIVIAAVDVRPVGPEQSMVGLAAVNRFVFDLIGVNMQWYHLTEWLGMAVLLIPLFFALMGFRQLMQRRSLWKVDRRLVLLGAFYALVAACYVLFEKVVINYRPVLLDEGLEASYPSSHTMLVICVMASAMIFLRSLPSIRKPIRAVFNVLSVLIIAVTVSGRLLSGVHWLTDIIGGMLLSAALVMLYHSAAVHTAGRK